MYLNSHELGCGKCGLCDEKLKDDDKIPTHYLRKCSKKQLRCIFCDLDLEREEFEGHICKDNRN